MIHRTDRDIDLPAERGSELRTQLLDNLRRAYKPTPKLSAVDAAVMHAVHDRRTRASTAKSAPKGLRFRRRLSVPIAALAVLSLSVGAYVHSLGPTPVSAQTILRHAATAGLVPNQVTHFVYQITSSTGYSGTSQFWVQADASGAPARVAFDGTGATDAYIGVAMPRRVLGTYEVYKHDPSLLTGSWFKGQQTLDGVSVDVVQEPGGVTQSIDAQSYIPRGWDWTMKEGPLAGSSWHVRLLHYETVPASAIPAGSWHRHDLAPPPSTTRGSS